MIELVEQDNGRTLRVILPWVGLAMVREGNMVTQKAA
jgi:hypothetical protein